VGNLAPGIIPVNHLVIGYPAPGKIKVYLDNIVIRKKDGSLRKNIWSSKGDDINLIYRYKKTNYPNWAKAKQAKGFPLKSFQLEAVDLNQVK
jgi:hypothetical protein